MSNYTGRPVTEKSTVGPRPRRTYGGYYAVMRSPGKGVSSLSDTSLIITSSKQFIADTVTDINRSIEESFDTLSRLKLLISSISDTLLHIASTKIERLYDILLHIASSKQWSYSDTLLYIKAVKSTGADTLLWIKSKKIELSDTSLQITRAITSGTDTSLRVISQISSFYDTLLTLTTTFSSITDTILKLKYWITSISDTSLHILAEAKYDVIIKLKQYRTLLNDLIIVLKPRVVTEYDISVALFEKVSTEKALDKVSHSVPNMAEWVISEGGSDNLVRLKRFDKRTLQHRYKDSLLTYGRKHRVLDDEAVVVDENSTYLVDIDLDVPLFLGKEANWEDATFFFQKYSIVRTHEEQEVEYLSVTTFYYHEKRDLYTLYFIISVTDTRVYLTELNFKCSKWEENIPVKGFTNWYFYSVPHIPYQVITEGITVEVICRYIPPLGAGLSPADAISPTYTYRPPFIQEGTDFYTGMLPRVDYQKLSSYKLDVQGAVKEFSTQETIETKELYSTDSTFGYEQNWVLQLDQQDTYTIFSEHFKLRSDYILEEQNAPSY